MRKLLRCLVLPAIAGVFLGYAVSGMTAVNVVPSSHASTVIDTITPDKLKPAACAGITLTHLSVGSGNIPGTAANDLILGSSGNDTLGSDAPGQGSDCCVGTDTGANYLGSCTVTIP